MPPTNSKPSKKQLADWEFLVEAERQLKAQLCRKSTWHMLTTGLYPDVWRDHYHEPLHKEWCDWFDSTPPGGRKALKVARMHRKTRGLMIPYVIRAITADPNVRILIVTATDRNAIELCSGIKDHFQSNEHYRKLFPEMTFPRDAKIGTQYGFVHPARTSVGEINPTLLVTYLGAPLIGRRFDIIICDDAIDEDMVANPDLAIKTNAKMNELIPLLDINKTYNKWFIIGTPKSYNDYYALISPETAKDTIDEQGGPVNQVFDVKTRACLENANGDPDLTGEPILPNVFTRDVLLSILDQCRIDPKRGESFFWREYMVRIQAPGDVKYMPEWFDRWVPKLPADIVWAGIAIDSATKDEQILFRGDEAVLIAASFDTYGRLFVHDCAYSTGWKSADLRRELLSMAQRTGISNILKEKVGEGAMFGQIRAWFNEARLPVTFYPLPVRGMGKKVLRMIELTQAPLQAGKVYFVGQAGGGTLLNKFHGELVDEATHVGLWSKDNKLDAFSLFFHPNVRVMPPNQRTIEWKEVCAPALQVSTMRTNPAAFSIKPGIPLHQKKLALPPQGEEHILTMTEYAQEQTSSGRTPDDDLWWEKM